IPLQRSWYARVVVRVEAGGARHCEDGSRLRIEHDRGRALRVPAGDRRPKHGLRIRLDRVIERQVDVLPVASRARADGVDRAAQRVLDDRLAAGPPGQGPVETELEAGQPAIVDPRLPEHLRRDRLPTTPPP